MSSNPNNAIGTNAAYSGRTSVNAFNDDLAAYSRGILTGWNCQVGTGLTVLLGGGHSARDVAIAEDNAGNKTTINNISLDEVPVTLDTAPGANSRIDAIVAYVDNPPQGSDSTADNPEACGIIPVAGTPAVDPQAPDDNAIRTAITADGASGTTAYYVVLATVTVPTETTDLIAGYIQQGDKAVLNTNQIADGSITSSKIDFTTTTVEATVSRESGESFKNNVTRIHLGGHLYCYLYDHEPGYVNTSDNIHVVIKIPANKPTILGGSITPTISGEIHFDLVGHQSMTSDSSYISMDIWLCRANTPDNTVKVSAIIFTSEP